MNDGSGLRDGSKLWYAGMVVAVGLVFASTQISWALPERAPTADPAPLGTEWAVGQVDVTAPALTQQVPAARTKMVTLGRSAVPAVMLDAYRRATASVARTAPDCHLMVALLAGIGQVESGHARGGAVEATGRTLDPIVGPVLNGNGFAAIGDTDRGRYDGDRRWDRAVGPMQFIPSTWASWAADGNGDGVADPNNVYDASLASARYLCAAGGDVATWDGFRRAVLAYNHSEDYLALVLAWAQTFDGPD